MSSAANAGPPRLIVVGPPELHAALSSYPAEWDAQQPVPDTGALWTAFSSRAVDAASPLVVFSAAATAPEQMSGAIIAMLSTARPFVLVEDPSVAPAYQQAIAVALTGAGAPPDAVSWTLSVPDLISALRRYNATSTMPATVHTPAPLPAAGPISNPDLMYGSGATTSATDVPNLTPFQPTAFSAPVDYVQAPTQAVTAPPPIAEIAEAPRVTYDITTEIDPADLSWLTNSTPAGPEEPVVAVEPQTPVPAPYAAPPAPTAPAETSAFTPTPAPVAPTQALNESDWPNAMPGGSNQSGYQHHVTAPAAPAVVTQAVSEPQPVESTPGVPFEARPTVVGSPAAAHLPTLNVSNDPGPAANADRRVPPPPPRPGQMTIAVTSSKGGSGKSTTALMLATTLAQSSRAAGRPLRVALVDMDARDGQISTLIGTYLPTAYNVWTALQWTPDVIERSMVHADDLGIDCMLAPARPRTSAAVTTEFYRHVIRVLQSSYDVVILDTSANYLDAATWEVALVEATSILLVTTLANTSIQGMSRAIRDITDPVEIGGLGIPRERLSIVVNQSVAGVGIDMDFIVQAALHVPIVAAVPMATRDVLLATNHSAMQALLRHPFLGPAYFSLARAILPHLPLLPLAPGTPDAARGQLADTSARETPNRNLNELSSDSSSSIGDAASAVSSTLGG